jgi:hypothetical protein
MEAGASLRLQLNNFPVCNSLRRSGDAITTSLRFWLRGPQSGSN